MIYKAFLNGQEIDGFSVGGEEIKEIWGGDTLLWKKDDSLAMKEICSVTTTWTHVSDDGIQYPCQCEISIRNQTEDGEKYITDNTKAGIYVDYKNELAYILYDGICNVKGASYKDDVLKNAVQTVRRWDMDGNLQYESISWWYTKELQDNVFALGVGSDKQFSFTLRPLNIDIWPSVPNFVKTGVYTSGSGEFSSLDDLKKYFEIS